MESKFIRSLLSILGECRHCGVSVSEVAICRRHNAVALLSTVSAAVLTLSLALCWLH